MLGEDDGGQQQVVRPRAARVGDTGPAGAGRRRVRQRMVRRQEEDSGITNYLGGGGAVVCLSREGNIYKSK